MKKFEQIIKFGIVGVLAFLIDAGLLYALVRFLYWNAVPASIVSFIVSLIFNYLASMKYVFVHRDDMARWMEIVIFVVSSVIGLLINAFIMDRHRSNHQPLNAADRPFVVSDIYYGQQACGNSSGHDMEFRYPQVAFGCARTGC